MLEYYDEDFQSLSTFQHELMRYWVKENEIALVGEQKMKTKIRFVTRHLVIGDRKFEKIFPNVMKLPALKVKVQHKDTLNMLTGPASLRLI